MQRVHARWQMFLCGAVLTAVTTSAQTMPLNGVATARGFANGVAVEPTTTFASDARVVITFTNADVTDVATVRAVCYLMTTSGPSAVAEAETSTPAKGVVGAVTVAAPANGWTAGDYRVVLFAEAQQAGIATFTVVPAATSAPTTTTPRPAARTTTAVTPSTPPTSSAPATAAAPSRTRSGITLAAPAGWRADTTNSDVEHRLLGASGDAIAVSATAAAVNDDPRSLASAWEAAFVGRGKRFAVRLRGDEITLSGLRAYAAVYAGDGVYTKIVFIAAPGRGILVAGTFSTTRFVAGEMAFDQILRTAVIAR